MDIEANAATMQDSTQRVIATPDAALTSERESVVAPNLGQLRDRRLAQGVRRTTPNGIEKQAKGQSPLWTYFARRREQTGKDYCVMLAWEDGSQTFVVDVPVADPDNEEAVFADLNAQYYAQGGDGGNISACVASRVWREWSRRITLTGSAHQLRLGGLIDSNIFIGKACPKNKPDRGHLQACVDKYQAQVDWVDSQYCYPNDEATRPDWVHDWGCPGYKYPDRAECPQQELAYYLCRLNNLEGHWYMLQCFHRPALAEQQRSLNLKHEHPLILRYDGFKSAGYGQQPRDQKFPGLLIRERQLGSVFDMPHVVLKSITSVLMLVVTVVGRLGCGDWNSGFAAGSWFANWVAAIQFSRQRVFSRPGHHDGWYREASRRDD